MEKSGGPAVTLRKTNLTPKAIVYQKFGSKACYKVEEVQESVENGCPGLAIPLKGPPLYRCSLELPELFVVSGTFRKKKDAEQCAAEMALEKLGINIEADNSTEKDPWASLTERMKYLFSDEFLQSLHPLSGHLKAAWQRDGDLCGFTPASVVAACDAKITNFCKLLNPMVESNPSLALSFVVKAAARLSESVTIKGQLSIRKQHPYSPEIMESLSVIKSGNPDITRVQAVYIPSSLDKIVQPVELIISLDGYYLDAIAKKLGVTDANEVLLSRTIGKASSETRVYFAASESSTLDPSKDLNLACQLEGSLNARASYFCSQVIHGHAIMASIGYSWRSRDLFYEDLSLQSYYRMLVSKMPAGSYKLSREAILAAELPSTFTTKSNWRGSFPREILCSFCRQHRLSEPVFSFESLPLRAISLSISQKQIQDEQKQAYENGTSSVNGDSEPLDSGSLFRCEVKIFSRSQDLIIECFPKDTYKKQNDSVHSASLKVLSCMNEYFKDPGMPIEGLNHFANVFEIRFYPENFLKEFSFCKCVHNLQHQDKQEGTLSEARSANAPYTSPGQDICSWNIEGSKNGVCPTSGSILCVSYSVYLVAEGLHVKELIESNEEFEFEMGTEAVILPLEAVLTQMSVGQSATFSVELPRHEFILAAAEDPEKIMSLLSSRACCLECHVTLLCITEPPEERMEQALFSPPLSKQRVEYALQHIKKSCATSLVDYGCGSGSLLDSLLDYSTSLEKIVGVDISQKSLSRAAKTLHSKLSSMKSGSGIKTAVLYDGSILDFDSRLRGFDIGTCLEVIEHMDEDQASLFGNVALGYFQPKLLIVSTPNYEYNVILQRSSLTNQEDSDEKTDSQTYRFRNHDHKFEWTREQFNSWATELARQHNYSVEFSGVGGSADVEPGHASQIAVFTRAELPQRDDHLSNNDKFAGNCKVVWEWNYDDTSDTPFRSFF